MLPRLQSVKMEASESIMNNANRIDSLVNQLSSICHKVIGIEQNRALLQGLHSDFVVTARHSERLIRRPVLQKATRTVRLTAPETETGLYEACLPLHRQQNHAASITKLLDPSL